MIGSAKQTLQNALLLFDLVGGSQRGYSVTVVTEPLRDGQALGLVGFSSVVPVKRIVGRPGCPCACVERWCVGGLHFLAAVRTIHCTPPSRALPVSSRQWQCPSPV